MPLPMTGVDPLFLLTGPFGVALVLLLGLASAWRFLRNLSADRRRFRVRVGLSIVLLATVGWTWGRPREAGPGRLLLGRHAWFELRGMDIPDQPVRGRAIGPNLVATLLETAVTVGLVAFADASVARRLADRDARRCPRCGYPRPAPRDLAADGGRSHRCPECGLAVDPPPTHDGFDPRERRID